jgi:hypothetical protein
MLGSPGSNRPDISSVILFQARREKNCFHVGGHSAENFELQ